MAKEISQGQLNEILQDATYIGDEAEALRYVIDTVPYDQAIPGNSSILEKLLLLDHLQLNFFRPVFERVESEPGQPVRTGDLAVISQTFEIGEDAGPFDIQKVLGKLSKHRAALVSILKRIPLIDWERELQNGSKRITLYDFVQEMIYNDRKVLKEIADLVAIFQQDSHTQREIQAKARKQTLN